MEFAYILLVAYMLIGVILVIGKMEDIHANPDDYENVSGVFIFVSLLLLFVGWIIVLPAERRIDKLQEARRQKHHSDIFRD